MSTNYYFNIETGCKFCEDIEIHIGKSSVGWKPIFEKTRFYSSVEEIRGFYEENKEAITITNEYREELTFEELENGLINWNKERKDVLVANDNGIYRDKEGYIFTIKEFS